MSETMAGALPREARRIIEEEEALLARVSAVLDEARRTARRNDRGDLLSRLHELREEASTATEKELPTLLADMNQVRALMERRSTGTLPPPATPYFAHLRVRTGEGPRDYLLGRATYADTSAGVRIVDWRYAPIARLFYAYQEGEEFEEELPGGLAEGIVEARRVVVIERGVLTRIVAGPMVLGRDGDGAWRVESADASLGGGAGSAVREGVLGTGASRTARADITALLDADQFAALTARANAGLLVLGSAGSGKTTVALHRLSHLAFQNPQKFQPRRLKVLVPEEGLARLSRRLLAPLGLPDAQVETLERWTYRAACAAFGVRHLRVCQDTPALVVRLKRHPALHRVLLDRLRSYDASAASLNGVRRKLGELFSDRTFLAAVIEASGGDIPIPAIDDTVRHTLLQLSTPTADSLACADSDRIQTLDGQAIDSGTPEEIAGTIDSEDLAIALCLRSRHGPLRLERYAHLVVDEAEDATLFELQVLGRQVDGRSMTLAGDEMQQTTSSYAGWPEMLSAMGIPDAATVRLQVSYRCPRPITQLARTVLGPLATTPPPSSGRAGAPVGFHSFPGSAQAQLFLAEALRDLVDREPQASVGVVAADPATARTVYTVLRDVPGTRLVLDGSFTFDPGIDVTDVENVKGLEFDYVVLPDASSVSYPNTDDARRRLHVAVTRASHQLWVLSAGPRSHLFDA